MRGKHLQQGFALPTVVISATLMLIVMVTAASTVSSTSASLNQQYIDAVARDAAESGSARASICLRDNTMVLNTPITPATNCAGTTVGGQSAYVLSSSTLRTSYSATLTSTNSQGSTVEVTGTVERLRASSGSAYSTSTKSLKLNTLLTIDPNGDRGSKRWWYFGYRAILDFGVSGSATPVATRNNSGSTPEPNAREGSTVVADTSGNLQFWSDGRTIWDKTGNIMSNGDSLNGGSSAAQAVASFPLNLARTKYGVVSNTGQVEDGPGELYLSIVDMSLNGGNGAVTTKNQKLGTANGYTSEGVGAMPNNDGSAYFVYAYNAVTATITSFKITSSGTVTGPTTTSISPAPRICYNYPSGLTGYGTFNFSEDFSKMLVMVGAANCGDDQYGTVYIYNTNSTSGALTYTTSWSAAGSVVNGNGYSADFSPDERYVYTTAIYPGLITRYNIQSTSTIKTSEWKIGYATAQTGNEYNGADHVRRGPDGRMYMADHVYESLDVYPGRISIINTPSASTNSTTAIGLQLDGLTLAANSRGIWGLPQTATVFKPKVLLY